MRLVKRELQVWNKKPMLRCQKTKILNLMTLRTVSTRVLSPWFLKPQWRILLIQLNLCKYHVHECFDRGFSILVDDLIEQVASLDYEDNVGLQVKSGADQDIAYNQDNDPSLLHNAFNTPSRSVIDFNTKAERLKKTTEIAKKSLGKNVNLESK